MTVRVVAATLPTMIQPSALMSKMAWPVLAVAVCLFWGSRLGETRSRTDLRGLIADREVPYLMVGRDISFKTADLPPMSGCAQRCAVVVVSDTCPVCRTSLPELKQIVHAVASNPGVGLRVISIAGSELAQEMAAEARALGMDLPIGKVRSLESFVSETGIRGVPIVVIVDGNSVLRAVSKSVEPAVVAELMSLITPGRAR